MSDTPSPATASSSAPTPPPVPFWFPDTRSVLAVGTMAGVLGAAYARSWVDQATFSAVLPLGTLVLGWYFGSSKSSDDKNETIKDQLKKGQ